MIYPVTMNSLSLMDYGLFSFPTLVTKRQSSGYLNLIGYSRQWFCNFSEIVIPQITLLILVVEPHFWESKHEQNFCDLKLALLLPPVLGLTLILICISIYLYVRDMDKPLDL